VRRIGALPTAAPRALALALALVLGLGLSACQASGELVGRTITISGAATLSDPQASVEMRDLAVGKERILLNFWGSWCVPCRDEIPLLAAYAASAAPEATLVGVLYKDAAGPAAVTAAELGATWSTLLDPDGKIAAQIPVNAAPLTLLMDASGRVLDYQVGPFSSLEEIDAFVSGK